MAGFDCKTLPQPPAIKRGDVVQLRSGGPLMTVSKSEPDVTWCHWFSQSGEVVCHTFGTDLLKLATAGTPAQAS